MFGRRADAAVVADLSITRRFMPFISPRRGESLVYFSQEIEVDAALRRVDLLNRQRPAEQRVTLFQLLLHAFATALHARPRLNRFTAGGRLWQRDSVWITFSAKQELVDGSPVRTVKRCFGSDETLEQTVDGVSERLRVRRSPKKDRSEREMSLALWLPSFVIQLGLWALRKLDSLGLLTKSMIDADPMFTSMFVANLGSVGLDAAYHHLWEYGSCPIFAVIGRIRTREDGKRVVCIKYTFDERVEDGLYAATTLDEVKRSLEHEPRGGRDAKPRIFATR